MHGWYPVILSDGWHRENRKNNHAVLGTILYTASNGLQRLFFLRRVVLKEHRYISVVDDRVRFIRGYRFRGTWQMCTCMLRAKYKCKMCTSSRQLRTKKEGGETREGWGLMAKMKRCRSPSTIAHFDGFICIVFLRRLDFLATETPSCEYISIYL